MGTYHEARLGFIDPVTATEAAIAVAKLISAIFGGSAVGKRCEAYLKGETATLDPGCCQVKNGKIAIRIPFDLISVATDSEALTRVTCALCPPGTAGCGSPVVSVAAPLPAGSVGSYGLPAGLPSWVLPVGGLFLAAILLTGGRES